MQGLQVSCLFLTLHGLCWKVLLPLPPITIHPPRVIFLLLKFILKQILYQMSLLQKSEKENCLSFPRKWESSIFNGLRNTLDSRFHGNDDFCMRLKKEKRKLLSFPSVKSVVKAFLIQKLTLCSLPCTRRYRALGFSLIVLWCFILIINIRILNLNIIWQWK